METDLDSSLGNIAKDVEDSLMPLIRLLNSNLSDQSILNIAMDLFQKKNFTKGMTSTVQCAKKCLNASVLHRIIKDVTIGRICFTAFVSSYRITKKRFKGRLERSVSLWD